MASAARIAATAASAEWLRSFSLGGSLACSDSSSDSIASASVPALGTADADAAAVDDADGLGAMSCPAWGPMLPPLLLPLGCP